MPSAESIEIPDRFTPLINYHHGNSHYRKHAAEPLAELATTRQVVIARKPGKDFASVFCALPLNGTAGFREIFRQAGCHVYNEQNDFTYAHSGLILLHTQEGAPARFG